MAWTYDVSDLGTDTASGRLNSVRLLVGDTETLDQQLQNEEIVFALAQNTDNVYLTASWLAKVLASKFSRLVDTQLDGALQAKYSDLAKRYTELSDTLEYQGKKIGGGLGAVAGGMTITGINAVRANENRVMPSFRMDRFRNPPGYQTPDYE